MLKKKLNLDRFKKSMRGLIDFAILLEQADPAHREKILSDASAQDPDFVAKVMRKVVFFEELIFLDHLVLAEILSKTSPKILAHALNGVADDFKKTFVKQLGYRDQKLMIDEQEKLPKEISPQFILGAQKQVLKIARTLEAENKFVFELHECPRFKGRRAG